MARSSEEDLPIGQRRDDVSVVLAIAMLAAATWGSLKLLDILDRPRAKNKDPGHYGPGPWNF